MRLSSIKWKPVRGGNKKITRIVNERANFINSVEDDGAGVWWDAYTGKWMFEWWYVK